MFGLVYVPIVLVFLLLLVVNDYHPLRQLLPARRGNPYKRADDIVADAKASIDQAVAAQSELWEL